MWFIVSAVLKEEAPCSGNCVGDQFCNSDSGLISELLSIKLCHLLSNLLGLTYRSKREKILGKH